MRSFSPHIPYKPSTSNTWEILDLSSVLTSEEIAVWILVSGNTTYNQAKGVRHPDHTAGNWLETTIGGYKNWSVLRFVNSSKELEIYGHATAGRTWFHLMAAFTGDDVVLYNGFPTEYTFSQPVTGGEQCSQWDLTDRLPGEIGRAHI